MKKAHCPNMNHGRLNAPVRNCPMCGEVVNKAVKIRCDDEKHRSQRKERNTFCCDCGKKLTTI